MTEIVSPQPPYSALMREVEKDILPFCEQTGMGVLTYSTLQSGLLSGCMMRERILQLPEDDWRKVRSADFQEFRLSANLALVDVMARIRERHAVGATAVAIAWILRQSLVTGAIVGARRPVQVDGLIAASELRLSAAEVDEIRPFLPVGMGTNVPGVA